MAKKRKKDKSELPQTLRERAEVELELRNQELRNAQERSKTLERRVQEQTAQIRLQAQAIAHLGEGVLITAGQDWLESQILFANEAVCRITGYRPAELIGQPRRILQESGADTENLNRVRKELAAGHPCQDELVMRHKDGTSYVADVSVTPLRDVSGQYSNFVSIHRDITERKRAEQALRESEQRFRQMADHAPVMIWISGIDKLCTWVNKPWLEFTGRTLEQECGNGWTDGVHPDDFERCIETYGASFDARRPFIMEYRFLRHDGQWRWLLDTGIPLYNASGAFLGYIGSCIDITQRKKAEEALQESEELMRTILNTAADSIITIDRGGIVVSANPATERMFGYTLAELVGQNVKLLMPSPYREEHDAHITRYLESGQSHIIGMTRETVGLRKDGSTFPLELSVSEIDHLGLFTGIHRDISARKETERELDQYKRHLRTISSELMLAEESERQRLAQDLHDGLGQALFRARMKLDHASMDDEAAREIGAILDDVGKMVNTLTFELSPPVLRQLGLSAAMKWLSRDMKQRYGLTVQVNDDGQALALDERVALVVFRSVRELLINVAKHSQTDLATISVQKIGKNLQIIVEDQGKGFDLANQSNHVEAGHFGLFSIRERLEYLGGSFNIRSGAGEGTRVTLTVPAETDAQKLKS